MAPPPDAAPDEPPLAAFEEGVALQRYEWPAQQVARRLSELKRRLWPTPSVGPSGPRPSSAAAMGVSCSSLIASGFST